MDEKLNRARSFLRYYFKGKSPKLATVRGLTGEFLNKENGESVSYAAVRENIVKAVEELSWEGEIEIMAGIGLAADDDIEFLAREGAGLKV